MAACLICHKEVTTHLYVAIVDYETLRAGGTVKATHVGVRLPEHLMQGYRQSQPNYLPALKGDTAGLEANLRRFERPRKDGSVVGARGVIPANRVKPIKDDMLAQIDKRHDKALVENHCRGHEFGDVAKVIESHPLPIEIRWNPGAFIRPLLRTAVGRRPSHPIRAVMVRGKSDLRPALAELLEVTNG